MSNKDAVVWGIHAGRTGEADILFLKRKSLPWVGWRLVTWGCSNPTAKPSKLRLPKPIPKASQALSRSARVRYFALYTK